MSIRKRIWICRKSIFSGGWNFEDSAKKACYHFRNGTCEQDGKPCDDKQYRIVSESEWKSLKKG